jgi:hypothetical protein
MNKMGYRSSLLENVGAVVTAATVLLGATPAHAQVGWVGPIQASAVAVSPSGSSIWMLDGSPLSGGGYQADSVSIVDQNSRGGWGKIEVFNYQGLTPGNGVGSLSISASANGVPFVGWPNYFPALGIYYNEVSYYSPSYGFLNEDPMSGQAALPSFLSVAAGDLNHRQSDLVGVDPSGHTWVFAGQFFQTNSQIPAGATKIALFNETVSCGGGTMHQPFAVASDHTIWKYQFTQTVGSCIPHPANGCYAGCWKQVSGAATDITANDLILGYPAQNSPLWKWNNSNQSWVSFINSPNDGGASLQGIGASPAYSTVSPNANLIAYDSYGQIFQYCSQLYGQCGGQGYTGPTCCAFTQDFTSPATNPTGSSCVYSNPYYSQCLPR